LAGDPKNVPKTNKEGDMQGEIESKRLIWPSLAGFYNSISPYSYAIIRFAAGAVLVYHGYAKLFLGFAPIVAKNVIGPMGFPVPLAWTYFVALLEMFGGIALAIGLLTRPIALLLAIEFFFITIYSYSHGYFFTSKGGGYEYPLLLLVIYAAIFFRGAGRCSLDRMLDREF
jgi:putative oxidoreductase